MKNIYRFSKLIQLPKLIRTEKGDIGKRNHTKIAHLEYKI
jgi:hypothetical protein